MIGFLGDEVSDLAAELVRAILLDMLGRSTVGELIVKTAGESWRNWSRFRFVSRLPKFDYR